MKFIKLKKIPTKIKLESIADVSFVLYFSNAFVQLVCNWFFGRGVLSTSVAIMIIYLPLLFLCILNPKKYIKIDFIVLMLLLIVFFGVTFIIHPEYGLYYTREGYGVWDFVFQPMCGIYAYLFVRLIDSPSKIVHNMKISGCIMFVYFGYSLKKALERGFWYGVRGTDSNAEMSYSVSFGYQVLLFALIFMYSALKEKKLGDVVGAIVSVLFIFAGGSRGPVLFIGVFFVLYILVELKESKYKVQAVSIIFLVFGVLYIGYDIILQWIAVIIGKFGFSSRFINSLISGEILNDSGRNRIWETAIQMIIDNPNGYGALGSHHVISNLIYAGYPHSVVLEILIDFGVIIGSIILFLYFGKAISIMFNDKYSAWHPIFIPFFSTACGLFISLSYWHIPAFWGCIGIEYLCRNRGLNKRK